MTRNLILLGILAVAAVLAASLLAVPGYQEWTSDNPEAVAEFEAAMEAQRKLYKDEERKRLERTLKLDPDFAMAKLQLSRACEYSDPKRSEKLLEEALAADRSRLTDREAFLLERAELISNMEFDKASEAADAYLAEHPDDPYVLHIRGLEVWQRGDLETAERLNRHLLEISPNWVLAYNQLGYITMLQGRFAEAEEYFTSYRFIAPEQANPHDSLGELFLILGRYQEAIEGFEQALELRPDFWASYEHLMIAGALAQDWPLAERAVEMGRAVPDAPQEMFDVMACRLKLWKFDEEENWQAIQDEFEGGCVSEDERLKYVLDLHRAASMLGRFDEAKALEDQLRRTIDERAGTGWARRMEFMEPALLHMTGVRQALQGDLEGAITAMRAADRMLSYVTADIGIFKLSNRLLMAEVLRAMGDAGQAHKLLSQVRTINPELVREFEDDGMSWLGV